MSEVSPLFRQLVSRYAAFPIQFPQLKAVTVAQWMLESARGTSRLAVEHFNFAGMKYRQEMAGLATSVTHTTSHDGTSQYCRFATLDDFIKGYWRFLARSPYQGWENHTIDGEDFIEFIGSIWAPAASSPSNPGYSSKVLSLLSEAKDLLATAGASLGEEGPDVMEEPSVIEEKKVVVIDPGHGGTAAIGNSSPNNATARPSGIKEKKMTLDLAKLIKRSLEKLSAEDEAMHIEVIMTRETDRNLGLAERANVARDKKASIFLSIHFNGYNHVASGVETLVMPSSENVNLSEDRALALRINNAVVGALRQHRPETNNRGVKQQVLGVLRDIHLGNTMSSHRCRACLLEGEFIDVPAVDFLLNTGPSAEQVRQDMADSIAAAIIDDLKAQG